MRYRIFDQATGEMYSPEQALKRWLFVDPIGPVMQFVSHATGASMAERKDCVAMWSTGQRDRSKGEIFDGDLLKGSNGDIWTVRYAKSDACFAVGDVYLSLCLEKFNPEVIGNIHQHPGLLEAKQ